MRAPALLRRYAAEGWFFLYNSSIVFIIPYLSLLWKSQGFTGSQIGILSAVRPFTCSISGQLLVGVADAHRKHLLICIITYTVTLAARGSMGLAHGFVAHLLLILASEACQSPFSIMSDAAIAAATNEAGYSRKRVLASLGWGGLAPLSGWVVGKYGIPSSIAIYFGLVLAAFVPMVLLPLQELGAKRCSSTHEASAGKPARTKSAGLARSSAVPLLLEGACSGDLDDRQHGCHAAGLMIEMTGTGLEGQAELGAMAAGNPLVERINSKLAQAEAAGVVVRPLLTTADEDAAEEAAASAKVAAAEAARSAAEKDGQNSAWSIPAIGSPLMAQRQSLPPIACPAGMPLSPGGDAAVTAPPEFTPASLARMPSGVPSSCAGATPSALARTTSAATTAFYSVRSASSLSNVNSLYSPRAEQGARQPRAALFRQQSDAASVAASELVTPCTATAAGTAGGPAQASLLQQQQQQDQSQNQHQQPSLLKQFSNVSQALNGFDLSILEGSVSDGAFLTPRGNSFLPPNQQPLSPAPSAQYNPAATVQDGLLVLPEVHTVHPPHFLDGTRDSSQQGAGGSIHDRQLRRRTSSRRLLPPGGLPAAKVPLLSLAAMKVDAAGDAKVPLLPVSAGAKEALPEVVIPIGGSSRGGNSADSSTAAVPSADTGKDLSVWAGIKQMLRNPHHAAFFATAFLMGIGYGALGYETLYLRLSGAPGILLGVALLVSTCGEMPVFATTSWWLPKLGHELAFNIGMLGWIVRLALYTLLPLFPSLWCVLPVELLQGLTFAMAYGVGTVHIKAIAPPHLRSTMQSMFFGLYYGIGPAISGMAGGYIYESLGMRYVFIISASVLLVGWVCILLALRFATRHERTQRAAADQVAVH